MDGMDSLYVEQLERLVNHHGDDLPIIELHRSAHTPSGLIIFIILDKGERSNLKIFSYE